MKLKGWIREYEACVFDFDLTLADGSEWIVESFHRVLSAHGYMDVVDEDIRRTIGMTLEDAFARLTGETDRAVLEAYHREYTAVCRPYMAEHTRFYPEGLQLLRLLRESGIRLGIVSTKEGGVIVHTLELNGLDGWFDTVIGLKDAPAHKPDPSGLREAMRRLGVSERRTLYFGDNIIDGQTARNAGVDYVGVTTGVHSAEELARYPHRAVVATLAELYEATAEESGR